MSRRKNLQQENMFQTPTPVRRSKRLSKSNTKNKHNRTARTPLASLNNIPAESEALVTVKSAIDTQDKSCQTITDPVKPKITANKESQTPVDMSLDYLYMTQETPPIEYWIKLAEDRRLALVDSRKEINELLEEIKQLEDQVKDKELLESHAQYFAFMYKLASSY
jgi:hypothetical protein